MHDIFFYRDRNGFEPVAEFIEELAKRNDKDSRVQLHKIRDYLKILSEHGTFAGEPFVKHLDGEIWELRPLRNRIMFVAWINGSFVLLHPFLKQSQKTPVREIEKAKRELADLKERGMENG